MAADIGDQAPDFTLPATVVERVTLSEQRGKPIVLSFFPMAFTGDAEKGIGCRAHLRRLEDQYQAFQNAGAEVLGISCDSLPVQSAFSKDQGIEYPLLADWEPKGAIARAYGVYNAERGNPMRATFVIDGQGVIRYREIHQFPAIPDPETLLAEIGKLN